MKKILALLLAVLMLSSLTAGAFAAGEEPVFDTEPGGFRITVPDEVKNAVGVVEFLPGSVFSNDKEIYITCFNYVAMTAEEYDAWYNGLANNSNQTEEALQRFDAYLAAFSDLFAVTASATRELADFYEKTMHDRGFQTERIPLGEADGFVFDLYDFSPDSKETRDAWKSPYAEDFTRVYDSLKDALIKAELFAPDTSDPFKGLQISFETRDLDGNPVKSEDLFKQNRITMVNIWATWCEPCKSELKDLGEMNRRLQEKDCAIVGLLYDSAEEGAVEAGKALLANNHADYLNLMPPKGFDDMVNITAFPTSLMVDSSGTVVACILGNNTAAYEPVIQKLLAEKAAPAA